MITKLKILAFLSDHKETMNEHFGVTQIGLKEYLENNLYSKIDFTEA